MRRTPRSNTFVVRVHLTVIKFPVWKFLKCKSQVQSASFFSIPMLSWFPWDLSTVVSRLTNIKLSRLNVLFQYMCLASWGHLGILFWITYRQLRGSCLIVSRRMKRSLSHRGMLRLQFSPMWRYVDNYQHQRNAMPWSLGQKRNWNFRLSRSPQSLVLMPRRHITQDYKLHASALYIVM
jgi:hypothetical protein